MSDDENIIHVSFSRSGGKRDVSGKARAGKTPSAEPRLRAREPISDLYSLGEVSKLFGISTSRLAYWERTGFIVRSAKDGRRRYYTFQDLIGVRTAKGLLDRGVPLRSVRRSVEALRRSLPRVPHPLSSLRVSADGHSVVVKDGGGAFEPATGQQVLNFEVSSLRDDVVRVLRRTGWASDQRAAYECYLEGCRLDEDEDSLDQAEAAYCRAIALDPWLATARTNLGNLLFRRGDMEGAEQMYELALQIDPDQPEALYNLGFMGYDRGELQSAVSNFRRALEIDPSFADAHFNLAMVFEELGQRADARSHWETYLKLDPSSSWAEIARRHLE